MVDWPGLLKWSLTQQTEETKKPSVFKPMDEDTKKWLEEALKAHTFDEVERMKEIMKSISEPEPPGGDPKHLEQIKFDLEDLLDLMDGNLESARNFCIIGGLDLILKLAMDSNTNSKVRELGFRVMASMNQNNMKVQKVTIAKGGFDIIKVILTEPNTNVREQAMSALSAVVRGDNLDGIRYFIDVEGVELVEHILTNANEEKFTLKMKTKAVLLLRNLLHHDSNLDQPAYIDEEATKQGGSANIQMKPPKSEEEKKIETETIQNKKEACSKYKDIIKTKLAKNKFWTFTPELLKNKSSRGIDFRTNYLEALLVLAKSSALSTEVKSTTPALKEHLTFLKSNTDPSIIVNEDEVRILKELIALMESTKV